MKFNNYRPMCEFDLLKIQLYMLRSTAELLMDTISMIVKFKPIETTFGNICVGQPKE